MEAHCRWQCLNFRLKREYIAKIPNANLYFKIIYHAYTFLFLFIASHRSFKNILLRPMGLGPNKFKCWNEFRKCSGEGIPFLSIETFSRENVKFLNGQEWTPHPQLPDLQKSLTVKKVTDQYSFKS